MKTKFTDLLARFKAISALAEQEEADIASLTIGRTGGLSVLVVGSPESSLYLDEPRPCKQALIAFISACPDEYVFAFTALMYSGRDHESNPVEVWSYLRKTIPDKLEACRTIVEKSPRFEYIEAGVANLPAGMSIDALPGLIAAIR